MSAAMLKTLQTDQTEDSMRALYRSYGSELYGFAVGALGDGGQAEELVQEVFTRVWRHADSFDPDKASFRTWLYGIARNAIIDLKRRQSVRPALAAHPDAEEDHASVDDSFERALLRWQVGAARERLTPEHR